jgi:ribosomal protein L4
VSESINDNFVLSARNIPYFDTTLASIVNTYDILKYDHIVFTQGAFEMVEQRLADNGGNA